MDHERLVRLAVGGEVGAFVELTRRFRLFAFGSALALIHDFQQAEDVVQEAFLAAWIALPRLSDAAAFPGWLRGIVRNHAFRLLRGKRLQVLPLSEAAQVADEGTNCCWNGHSRCRTISRSLSSAQDPTPSVQA